MDAGIVIVKFDAKQLPDFLLVEVENAAGIKSNAFGQAFKIVVNNLAVPTLVSSQRHWLDSQYVDRQDGIFIYSLKEIPIDDSFLVKIVFWKAEIENLRLRFYLTQL